MIRHAALFRLHHAPGSAGEARFMLALAALKEIPGVKDFRISREISPKNSFDYAVSMNFDGPLEYEAYNLHPLHEAFVRDMWLPEVADFMEHDTTAL